MTCTFFGHKNAPNKIEPSLRSALVDLIQNKNVDLFYIESQGNFDYMAKTILKSLKIDCPHINYFIVLAYLPTQKSKYNGCSHSDTIYPELLENIPPRYAISKRNMWMIDRSDYVITYVKNNFGNSAHFKRIAENRGKNILNIDI